MHVTLAVMSECFLLSGVSWDSEKDESVWTALTSPKYRHSCNKACGCGLYPWLILKEAQGLEKVCVPVLVCVPKLTHGCH